MVSPEAALAQEGVIKFKANRIDVPHFISSHKSLNHWRDVFFNYDLIGGNNPNRYDGYGFGNVSQRLFPDRSAFITTATQTGHLPMLDMELDYAVIAAHDFEANSVTSYGLEAPSSEAMTHAAVYDADPNVGAVLHAHHPMWKIADKLGLPITDPGVEYGTPEMAYEVFRLFDETDVRNIGVFSMGGHEDGIISFGRTPREAGIRMLRTLYRANTRIL